MKCQSCRDYFAIYSHNPTGECDCPPCVGYCKCPAPQLTKHAEGCWSWGPEHYMCAYRHIKNLERYKDDGK